MAQYPKGKTNRPPSHPGEVLKELWLDELGYSQAHFADLLLKACKEKVKRSTLQTKLNEVIMGKRSMSAEFAVLISRVLKTDPKMWMSLQIELDIWRAEQDVA